MHAAPDWLGHRPVTVACKQMTCDWNMAANIDRAERLVRAAAGVQIILLPELFETPYFCIERTERHYRRPKPLTGSSTIRRFQRVARELGVVLPVSWFEQAGQARFNSVAVIDADGSVLALEFFGASFIAVQQGSKVCEAGRSGEAVLVYTFDLEVYRRYRQAWCLFRDRRPDLYGALLTHDARAPSR